MTPRARTNQLLYQAELLLAIAPGEDEHAEARRMAAEEGALALLELALESLVSELTEFTTQGAAPDWRTLLRSPDLDLAELERLRTLIERPDSWLHRLVSRLGMLHSSDGAARRSSGAAQGMIAVGGPELASELLECLDDAKREISALRLTNEEW
ncbi:hypothetical protein OM427_16310 [Halomonas sp. 18H]|uniref:DUF6586 family protein n=1 Tax=Halomonas almeriensis TaxID=308163 RepID=UPI0022303294|nr:MULTISPECIES: DUF6586 family protein [Halomonas]MCW4151096.1 hypothetical protein [Halomonas sp. 18H]MDN3552976.1 hypothetical protein [Halomonas almeriensis]